MHTSPSPTVKNYAVALFLLIATAVPTQAQTAASAAPFDILDNSFIVEEAFNQEAGIFQNTFGVRLGQGSDWESGFTQEWPVRSQSHQLSYTVPVGRLGGATGVGDFLVNYRYQLWLEGARRPAFSPRISVILPSGNQEEGRGTGVVGWQVNLPFSKQSRNLYYHWNAGFTWSPGVSPAPGPSATSDVNLLTPHLAASAIWRTGTMFNVMLETLAEFEEAVDPTGATERSTAFTVSPGFRTGWNPSDHQIVLGFAVPITFGQSATDAAGFVYLSYELPFKR